MLNLWLILLNHLSYFQCPESVQQSVQTTHDDYQDYAHNPTETPTEKSLVRLHTNVMWYSLVRQLNMYNDSRGYIVYSVIAQRKCYSS